MRASDLIEQELERLEERIQELLDQKKELLRALKTLQKGGQ